MDSQQAKQILKAYRPGVDDAEPQVAEALSFAKRDAALSRWLDQQVALDAILRAKLKSVDAPIGLKTRILANAPIARPVTAWWQRPVWLAAAASLAVLVGLAAFWMRPQAPSSFAAYRAKMVAFVSVEYKLDLKTASFDEFRQAVAKNKFPPVPSLTPTLAKLDLEGGCLLDWHGHQVTLMCLEAKDHDVWLFAVENAALPDVPAPAPVFAKTGKITTASWTDGERTYILATEGDEAELKSYL